jgi:hypothetical protein
MNELIKSYHDKSRPGYCAKVGLVDEIVKWMSCVIISVLSSAQPIRIPRALRLPSDDYSPRNPRLGRNEGHAITIKKLGYNGLYKQLIIIRRIMMI